MIYGIIKIIWSILLLYALYRGGDIHDFITGILDKFNDLIFERGQ